MFVPGCSRLAASRRRWRRRRRACETESRTRAERPRIGNNITVSEFVRVFIQSYLAVYIYYVRTSTCRHYCRSSVFGLLLLLLFSQRRGRVQTINRLVHGRPSVNTHYTIRDSIIIIIIITTTTIVSIPMAYKYLGYDTYFMVSCEIHRNPRSRDQQPRRADAQTVV